MIPDEHVQKTVMDTFNAHIIDAPPMKFNCMFYVAAHGLDILDGTEVSMALRDNGGGGYKVY